MCSAVLLAGCSTFENGSAATVDGKSIPITTVDALTTAVNTAKGGPKNPSNATLNGDDGRSALGILIQFAVAEQALAGLHESPTADELQAADQQLQQLKLTGKNRDLVKTGLASQSALDRAITDHWATPLGRKVLDDIYASQPNWEQVCATGIVGSADKRADVQKLIDGGAKLTDGAAFQAAGFQALSATGEFCTTADGVPADLAAGFADTATTGVQAIEFKNQSGQTGVVFFIAGGRRTVKRGDRALEDVAAQAISSAAQSGRSPVMAAAIRRSTIAVDPRFGSYDPKKGIVPPIAPTTTVPASRLVPQGAVSTNGSAGTATSGSGG